MVGASILSKKVTETVQDPNFSQNVTSYLSAVTEKVTESTKKGYGFVARQIEASLNEGRPPGNATSSPSLPGYGGSSEPHVEGDDDNGFDSGGSGTGLCACA